MKTIKKRFLQMMLIAILIAVLVAGNVLAVGIKWFTEGEIVQEGEERCIMYGTYNPSPRDIKVTIEVEGELKNLLIGATSEEKIVKANTPSSEIVELNYCFNVPKVYKENCLVGSLVCEQTCEEGLKEYKGEVVITEKSVESGAAQMTGSGTSIAAGAPLRLQVSCSPYDRDWTPVYIVLVIVIGLLIVFLLYRKYRKPRLQRDEEKLRKLQDRIQRQKR